MSIKISEKHGVNPSLGVCFFCGEETGEIALCGKLKNDAEAPKRMILSYEPCNKCKEQMDKGITLIAVTKENLENERAPISKDGDKFLYPTGQWMVITKDFAKRLFEIDDNDEIIQRKNCLVSQDFIEELDKKFQEIGE